MADARELRGELFFAPAEFRPVGQLVDIVVIRRTSCGGDYAGYSPRYVRRTRALFAAGDGATARRFVIPRAGGDRRRNVIRHS